MAINPLVLPSSDSTLLAEYTKYFSLSISGSPRPALSKVVHAFNNIPYENLSKVVRAAGASHPNAGMEGPAEILAGHYRWGTGGTCFSLTATLLHLVRSLGFRAEPILADRFYGPDTHCALCVWIDDAPHLLDPGFLISEPVPLFSNTTQHLETAFNRLILVGGNNGETLELRTADQNGEKRRLTYRTAPVDDVEFLAAWEKSFSWDMMHYPILTQVREGRQIYIQKDRIMMRDRQSVSRTVLDHDEMAAWISRHFGIALQVVQAAFDILAGKGGARG